MLHRTCAVAGCGKKIEARGLCAAHYARLRRHGDALGGGTSKGAAREFLERAIAYTGDDCLIWPYWRSEHGYAKITINRQSLIVPRLVCVRVHGEPPTDTEAAHSCGNGAEGCITPNHLRWATMLENAADTIAHERTQRGERQIHHKLTEDDIREIRRIGTSVDTRLTAERFGVDRKHLYAILSRKR